MNAGATVHASAALVGEQGVLIRGASGCGKSALLLALITMDAERNALAADDRVALAAHHGRLVASVPPELAGLIEVRGQGILSFPHVSPVVIDLVVDLVALAEAPRMPEGDDAVAEIAGIWLPRLTLPAGASDGAVRVLTALVHRNRAESLRSQPLALRKRSVNMRPSARPGPGPGSGSA